MKSTYFSISLWTLLITVASKCMVSLATHSFANPKTLKKKVEGLVGYKCNFAQGAHALDPRLHENRSLLCTINSHFIYDTIHLIIPSGSVNSHFKLLPSTCFKKVYKDVSKREEVDPKKDLGLIDAHLDHDTKSTYIRNSITLSPFNTEDVLFYCICDNTAETSGSIKGRMAFVEVHVLKYPYEIIGINLTEDPHTYLQSQKKKADFKDNKLELTVLPGTLVVLACKEVDTKCFQRSKTNLLNSKKIIFHDDLAIFKAPSYVPKFDVTAECACQADKTVYEVVVKPVDQKKPIHGCDFTDSQEASLTQKMKLSDFAENELEKECVIHLNKEKIDMLIGIHCPGKIEPHCFFQVYEYDVSGKATDTSKIVYVDNRLGMSGFEFYEDVKDNYPLKIFSLTGNLQNAKSFACTCKHNNKTGIMVVNIAASYTHVMSTMLIVTIILIFNIM